MINKDVSEIQKIRKQFMEDKIELINITPFCELSLGQSGVCNNSFEPEDPIYHIQVKYRNKQIAVFGSSDCYVVDDKYFIYKTGDRMGSDFIIFRKAKK
jgi:hypothetical protein